MCTSQAHVAPRRHGEIFPVLLAGVDLSVGAVAAFSGACVVTITTALGSTNTGVALGCAVGVATGALIGAGQGFVIQKFSVPAFLVTLASQNILYGMTQLLTANQVVSLLGPASFNFIGGGKLLEIPFPIIILLIGGALSFFALTRTVFGRRIYAVGGNQTSSFLSGIPVLRTTLFAYIFSATAAAIAGIVLASMTQQSINNAAQGYEFDVLTALVVGGTSLMGGEGTLQGGMYGALLVGLLNNGLRLMGVPDIYHSVVKGIIIILAVAVGWRARNK